MGDGRILGEQLGDAGGVGDAVIALGVVDIGDAVPVADLGHAHPVGPVGADEDLVLVPHHAGEDALHPEGAAALHQDNGIVILGHVPQLEQLAADLLGDGLVVVIPGAPVHQHLLLHGIGGGQGAGGQQFIGIHGRFLLFSQTAGSALGPLGQLLVGGEQLEGQRLVKDAGVGGLVGGVGGLTLIEGVGVGLDQLGAAVFNNSLGHLHGQGIGVLPLVQDGH